MASYLKLGKIVSAHGLKGEVVLEHYLGKSSSLKNLEALYIEEKKENCKEFLNKYKFLEYVESFDFESVDIEGKLLLNFFIMIQYYKNGKVYLILFQ